MRTVGDVVSSGAKIAAHATPLLLAGLGKEKKARKPSEWNTLVSKIRKEKQISLKDAMKHIKDNNLYQKKNKNGRQCSFPPFTGECRCKHKKCNAFNNAKNWKRQAIQI